MLSFDSRGLVWTATADAQDAFEGLGSFASGSQYTLAQPVATKMQHRKKYNKQSKKH